jgi:hypothetical protein
MLWLDEKLGCGIAAISPFYSLFQSKDEPEGSEG